MKTVKTVKTATDNKSDQKLSEALVLLKEVFRQARRRGENDGIGDIVADMSAIEANVRAVARKVNAVRRLLE